MAPRRLRHARRRALRWALRCGRRRAVRWALRWAWWGRLCPPTLAKRTEDGIEGGADQCLVRAAAFRVEDGDERHRGGDLLLAPCSGKGPLRAGRVARGHDTACTSIATAGEHRPHFFPDAPTRVRSADLEARQRPNSPCYSLATNRQRRRRKAPRRRCSHKEKPRISAGFFWRSGRDSNPRPPA